MVKHINEINLEKNHETYTRFVVGGTHCKIDDLSICTPNIILFISLVGYTLFLPSKNYLSHRILDNFPRTIK